jgi:hypothetical protein
VARRHCTYGTEGCSGGYGRRPGSRG